MLNLLDAATLEQSGVVANCRMNRERTLTGSNGYSVEIGFNPLEWLKNLRLSRDSTSDKTASTNSTSAKTVSWLDLCCGSGTALIQAARIAVQNGIDDRVALVGVDLVAMFAKSDQELKCLRLLTATLTDWQPNRKFDLITCVHGLHYIGDKLGLVTRAASWLTTDGLLVASLDLSNIRVQGYPSGNRVLLAQMRDYRLDFDRRKKRLRCHGHRVIQMPFEYLGADDQAGPNYTGQPAVNSHYKRV